MKVKYAEYFLLSLELRFLVCLQYCEQRISNIRVDTHKDNLIMQHLLAKSGYEKCGIIFVEDGSPRIAYQKCTSKKYDDDNLW
jgi:RimJ/RimL family protein N-acetyltransferase